MRKQLQLEDLRSEVVDIATLRPHPDNPRNGDTDLIVQSIKAHGLFRPILISGDDVVLAGNHTYMAMMELERRKIAVTRLPIKHDSDQAREIMLMDNRSSDVAKYDDGQLLKLLDSIHESSGDLVGTGFNDDFYKNLAEKLADDPPTGFPSVGDGINTDYQCPSCGYAWSGKPK